MYMQVGNELPVAAASKNGSMHVCLHLSFSTRNKSGRMRAKTKTKNKNKNKNKNKKAPVPPRHQQHAYDVVQRTLPGTRDAYRCNLPDPTTQTQVAARRTPVRLLGLRSTMVMMNP
jgi:hypothetical protein